MRSEKRQKNRRRVIKAVNDERIMIIGSNRGKKYTRDKNKIGEGKQINKIQKHKQHKTKNRNTRNTK